MVQCADNYRNKCIAVVYDISMFCNYYGSMGQPFPVHETQDHDA